MSEVRPSKAAILGALSKALDMVEGQPEGHSLRTASIALKIGSELGLSVEDREDLYFASVLKDSGCSNNSVRVHKIFGGDEHRAKYAVKLSDWTSTAESIKFVWRHTEAGKSLVHKLRRMAANVGTPQQVMREVTEARCTRGAAIASMLSFRPAVASAIYNLDEHWDGRGAAHGVRGDAIPLLGRILCLSQSVEVFLTAFGPIAALEMARSRSGTWFDPDIVRAFESAFRKEDDLAAIGEANPAELALPHLRTSAMDSDLDAICQSFAMIVDAKSSFTAEHSTRVMRYADQVGAAFDFSPDRLANLRRAALLHDIGKLGVPTGILEKRDRLDSHEYDRIKQHPRLGHEVLSRIPSFAYFAEVASCHHERLDGKGYWRGICADHLSLDVRIVSACDVYDAISACRPYREALEPDVVWSIMDSESGTSLDPAVVDALRFCCSPSKVESMPDLPMAA
jgi:HD-GYP domain-containing protein (c-di-GMP phosphodiesterase class II)